MKARKYSYHRNLPHILKGDQPHFVTFVTSHRWELPPLARDAVLKHCMHDDGVKVKVHAVVVMPDHVHMILTPLRSNAGEYFTFEEILGGIKGTSAHSINRLLGRRGRVWQDESFDHVLRSEEGLAEKTEYICQNPVRKGLVAMTEQYRWLWREEGTAI
jgi:REP element-mobilizing transposase RayT